MEVTKMLKPNEAAERLNVSVKTLQRWDREGILVAQRNPKGRRIYTEDQIDKILEKNDGAIIPDGDFSYEELVLKALHLSHGEHINIYMINEDGSTQIFCLSCAFVVGSNVLLLGLYGFPTTLKIMSQSEDDNNYITDGEVEEYFKSYLQLNSELSWKEK
jgi:hypothetical protein